MKYLIILLAILTSCSPDYHIRKAIFKQPNILDKFNDTISLTDVRLDTIYYADTFAIVQTIIRRDTIIETRYLKPQTRYEIKYRYKTITDTIKERERTVRIETRQENRTERVESRGKWWMWLIVGIFLGIFTHRWIKSIF